MFATVEDYRVVVMDFLSEGVVEIASDTVGHLAELGDELDQLARGLVHSSVVLLGFFPGDFFGDVRRDVGSGSVRKVSDVVMSVRPQFLQQVAVATCTVAVQEAKLAVRKIVTKERHMVVRPAELISVFTRVEVPHVGHRREPETAL